MHPQGYSWGNLIYIIKRKTRSLIICKTAKTPQKPLTRFKLRNMFNYEPATGYIDLIVLLSGALRKNEVLLVETF